MESESFCEDFASENREIVEAANEATLNLLPTKSREKYEKCYNQFCEWRVSQHVEGVDENIMLAFFFGKSKILKASSLWSTYSMIKSTLQIHEGLDISKYRKLIAFLKKQNEKYEPKKSKVLTSEHVLTFLNEASNDSFLFLKVALIFSLNGACRSEELRSLTVDDIEETESVVLVTLRNTKTKKKRVFTITSEANGIELYKQYRKLRPENISHRRFFICYRKGKCTVQPVGINTFYGMPRKIAEYLKLPEASGYTGHCMRRTSATLLVDHGGSISDLKRLGGWISTSSAEGYIEDSITNKIQTSKKIFSTLNHQQNMSKHHPPSPKLIKLMEQQQIDLEQQFQSTSSSVDLSTRATSSGLSFHNLTNCTVNIYQNK